MAINWDSLNAAVADIYTRFTRPRCTSLQHAFIAYAKQLPSFVDNAFAADLISGIRSVRLKKFEEHNYTITHGALVTSAEVMAIEDFDLATGVTRATLANAELATIWNEAGHLALPCGDAGIARSQPLELFAMYPVELVSFREYYVLRMPQAIDLKELDMAMPAFYRAVNGRALSQEVRLSLLSNSQDGSAILAGALPVGSVHDVISTYNALFAFVHRDPTQLAATHAACWNSDTYRAATKADEALKMLAASNEMPSITHKILPLIKQNSLFDGSARVASVWRLMPFAIELRNNKYGYEVLELITAMFAVLYQQLLQELLFEDMTTCLL